jgi:magnesium transporter
MIKYYYKSFKDLNVKSGNRFKNGSWVHINEPSLEELEKLSEKFDLELDLLKDALDPFEAPRFEREENLVYAYVRTPFVDRGRISSTVILFVIGKNFLLTLSSKPVSFFEKFFNNKINFSTKKPINLFLKIFLEITNVYNSSLITISKNIFQASANIEKIQNKDIAEFVNYEQISNDYLSRLIQNNLVVYRIISDKQLKLNEKDHELAEDLSLAIGQLIEVSKNCLQSVKNIRDSYSTILSNNLNRVIKLLTSLTIIFNIPTMVAGLWGMNVPVPYANNPFAFLIVLGIIVIICAALIWLFIRKDYI